VKPGRLAAALLLAAFVAAVPSSTGPERSHAVQLPAVKVEPPGDDRPETAAARLDSTRAALEDFYLAPE